MAPGRRSSRRRGASRSTFVTGASTPRRSGRTIWPTGSTRPDFPIPISSSAPPARCGCRISCSGRPPMPNSSSCRSCGPISTTRLSSPRSINMRRASVGSALSSSRPPSSRRREAMGMTASDDSPATGSAPQRFGPDLWPRVAAAVAMGSVAVAATWIGGFLFAAFWWLASIVVLWEWQRLVGGERLIVARVVAGAVALALSALHDSIAGVVAALILGAAAVGWIAGGRQGIWAAAGVLYAGALVASVGLLRVSPSFGMASILWLFAVVWGADIAAYFAGRLIGGPRLWPRVSPGKTWAGAIVGAFAGAVLGLMLAAWTNRLAALFWLGLATAIVSELGDLFESALKRRFGAKDSSGLIPGHGGLMDRLDAFTSASFFAAAVAILHPKGDYIASGLFQW